MANTSEQSQRQRQPTMETPPPTTRPDGPEPAGSYIDADVATGYDHGDQRPADGNGYVYDSFPSSDSVTALPAGPSEPSDDALSARTPARARALAPDLLRGVLMLLMAMDHTALALHTWEHGTGRVNEQDGFVVARFNSTAAYVVRTLTHLCAPGFTFLLGMGVVYLGRSRRRLGWSTGRLVRYFFVRGLVLALVNEAFGVIISGGKVWFLNIVLFSLAVDYFLAGLMWLAVDGSEAALTGAIDRVLSSRSDDEDDEDDEEAGARRPLLRDPLARKVGVMERSAAWSWHAHNAALLALSVVTIWWNVWLSPTGGHCDVEASSDMDAAGDQGTAGDNGQALLRLWFWPVATAQVMSGFPPMAWLTFAILGLVYGRVLTARSWSRRSLAAGHVAAAVLLLVVFVLTRVFRFGNLSEGCLQTPEHKLRPDANPYLVSAASFFYIVKYPPDVAFWAFTLACNLLLLGAFGAVPVRIAGRATMLLDFGTTALFFYVAHQPVIFGISPLLIKLFGHDTGVSDPWGEGDDSRGIDALGWYFAIWAGAMLALWPVCRAYGRFKSTKSADSIWRFF